MAIFPLAAVDFGTGPVHKDYSYVSKLISASNSAGTGSFVLLHYQNCQWNGFGPDSLLSSRKTSGYDSDTSIISGCPQQAV